MTVARRIVHLGLGNFHRAHQCWWTGAAAGPDDAEAWTISAFTGRRPDAARLLSAQGCRYTLIERGPDGDRFTLVTALAEALDGADLGTFTRRVADRATGAITLTVTEAGYHRGPDGRLDHASDGVTHDRTELVRALRATGSTHPPDARLVTAPARLLIGLAARQRADAGPLAIVPCDNLATNGQALRGVLLELAAGTDPVLAEWIEENVAFVDTSVDRITPRSTEADRAAAAAATGFADRAPVVTEPFRYWVLSGEFPAGRPAWDRPGARLVPDIRPWERRKLWLLNGAHSLLAYAGLLAGYRTVAAAMADGRIAALVDHWWDEVGALLAPDGLDLTGYRRQLRDRFTNPAIAHRLDQIAEDGVHKLRIRVAEPALLLRAAGHPADAAAAILAAWIDHLQTGAGRGPGRWPAPAAGSATGRHVAALSEPLADDAGFVAAVDAHRRPA